MRFFLPFILLLFATRLPAQANSDTLYSLGFVAKRGLPGHAFVVWEKSATGATKPHQVAAFGLYPKSRVHAAFSVFSSVAGFLRPEWKQPADSASTRLKMLRILVTKTQFEAALQIRENWVREGRYRLFVHDCVTFMYTVAREVGLAVPERLLVTYSPIRYWHKFRFLYQRQTGNS